MSKDDGQLLECFSKEGDDAAFEEVLRRYSSLVSGACLRILADSHDAKDAFQATFLVLQKKADSLTKFESIAGWLYQVAVRCSLNLRKSKLAMENLKMRAEQQSSDASVSDSKDWSEVRPIIDEELSDLSEKYRLPLILCYLEGKTSEEATGLLNLNSSTLRKRLERARNLLRNRLVKRGLTLSTAIIVSGLSKQTQAAVSESFIHSTLKTLIVESGGSATSTMVSQKIAQVTLKSMFREKLSTIIASCLIALGSMGGLWVCLKLFNSDSVKTASNSSSRPPSALVQAPPSAQTFGKRTFKKRDLLLQADLREAVRGNDLDRVKKLVAQGADVNPPKNSLETPLIKWAREKPEILHFLLNSGANRQLLDESDLELAVRKNDPSELASIISRNNDLSKLDGSKALELTVHVGSSELMNILLTAGVKPNDYFKNWSNLKWAIALEDIPKLQTIIKSDGINTQDKDGFTALMYAAKYKRFQIVQYLIGQGADPKLKDNLGNGALNYAAEKGDLNMIQCLLDSGADVNNSNKEGFTPLTSALLGGNTEAVRLLVSRGANVSGAPTKNSDILSLAVRNEQSGLIKELATRGVAANFKVSDRKNALVVAAYSPFHNPRVVRSLLDLGADTSCKPDWTELNWAITCNDIEWVKKLLKEGVDVNSRDEEGQTPLFYAARYGDLDILDVLLKRGADLKITSKSGSTVLDMTFNSGQEVRDFLIHAGAPLDSLDEFNAAIRVGDMKSVEHLLQTDLDINKKDHHGITPLMYAAEKGNIEIIKLLLEEGANTEVKDSKGKSAAEFTYSKEAKKLLRKSEILPPESASLTFEQIAEMTRNEVRSLDLAKKQYAVDHENEIKETLVPEFKVLLRYLRKSDRLAQREGKDFFGNPYIINPFNKDSQVNPTTKQMLQSVAGDQFWGPYS
jgi:RNA polymerase sigma factor (sigma-70 family)